ncbi:ABC transporter permease subunit [Corynebacterium pseudotuberculosis]|uniref:ABC transporter permease subunit n=1 Tax=Corynebacterium pseudotuberculosis 258 TaxID=1168865 RepID=A0AAU8PWN9_CORPS|nr:ABC transporter permease subunit [Corynebacterium pseudotuberculosis]AER68694.1 Oligopeptide transport system permease protein oppC [Corynebacterium pseudotuberculosis 1/06-A]AEQ06182.1 ABC transporter permease subunit [Corynebacterium pseudotuberculosis CIP 52.97]AFB71961.1 ABC transporter permease subunit [Corynebacterium pseudotuberculosis 316]AFK16271.1 ABC transporter permease subunit [Corynebacterium pseudotuberculosis 258]AKS12970.1 Oligopeptide transport system permease protein [Cor
MTRKIFALLVLAISICGPLVAQLFQLPTPNAAAGLPFDTAGNGALLGTDHLGRSVVSAVLHGGQALILTALAAGTLTTVVGAIVGCFGVLRPKMGFVVETCADATILVPAVIVLLLVSVLYPNSGLWLLVVVAVAVGSPYAARVIAAAAYPVAHSGYVQAARNAGASDISVIMRDILPNISTVLRSVWGLRVVEALHLLAVASFLGVGAKLGEFAWSAMVRDNAGGITLNPFAVLAPAAMLAVASIAVMALIKQKEAQ